MFKRKLRKLIWQYVILSILGLSIAVLAVKAWDETMSDEELIHYATKYPEEANLQKMLKSRGLTISEEL